MVDNLQMKIEEQTQTIIGLQEAISKLEGDTRNRFVFGLDLLFLCTEETGKNKTGTASSPSKSCLTRKPKSWNTFNKKDYTLPRLSE